MKNIPLKAVVFDLDDTLYNERDFFRSGFTAVAQVLKERGVQDAAAAVSWLEQYHHNESRSGVFQKLAGQLGFSPEWIPALVSVFRSHRPAIRLADDALEVLPRLRESFRLGCVTDGWAAVQRGKIEALGISGMLDAIVIADDHGRDYWKPHARPFLECCQSLGVAPAEALFVGDNPERDLLGAHNCGMPFVWIRRPGACFSLQGPANPGMMPRCEVADLRELEQWLAQRGGVA